MKKIKKSDLEIKPRVISRLNDTPNPNEDDRFATLQCSYRCTQACASADPCDTFGADCPITLYDVKQCPSINPCPSKNCSELTCYVSEDCVDSESHAPLCCPQTYGADDCPKPESYGCQDTRVCIETRPPQCAIPATAEEDICHTGTCETFCMICGTMNDETCVGQSECICMETGTECIVSYECVSDDCNANSTDTNCVAQSDECPTFDADCPTVAGESCEAACNTSDEVEP